MSSIGTTDINSLPNPGGQDLLRNAPQSNQIYEYDPNKEINNVVSDVQQASRSGLLELPTKDIPITTNHVVKDKEIVPNYIPDASTEDYIKQHQSLYDIQTNVNVNAKNQDSIDYIIDEFGLPIVISIVYFIFQSTKTKNYIYKIIPSFHGSDSTPTTRGYMVISAFFGLSVYILNKTLYKFKM